MKLLLDENLPKKLKYRFPDCFEVKTVPEMKWGGIKNGELLRKLSEENLSVLISMDKNFSHQQNLAKYSICLIILNTNDNRYETLLKFMSKLLMTLKDDLEDGLVILE